MLHEHAKRDRLLVQRGLFAAPSPTVPDDMYATVEAGKAARHRTDVVLTGGGIVETNTYFGRFAASYWQRWTDVDSVRVSFTYRSAGRARIDVRASDASGYERTVHTQDITGSGELSVDAAIDRFVDGGALWLRFSALEGELAISDVRWDTAAPEHVRPAAVVICTFNRADDCATTVGTFVSDAGAMAEIDLVCVVDQGNDQVRSRPAFTEIEERLGSKLRYLTQANLGGAGGFTRGMFEVLGTPGAEHANVILMDDDILCEPESILRMNAFANLTKAPTIIGAQMLSLMTPERLHVSAEREVLDEIKAGELTAEALMGVDLTKTNQDARFDAGWNGWWTCLLPAEIIADIGLPLPLFFQWDDIEYGIRARHRGYATVTLPNTGVWHADFKWKDYDDWSRYFSIRNGLIVSALYGGFDGKIISKYLFQKTLELIVSMQYGLAHTFIRAAEDFLKGPEFLHDGGQSVLKEIRAEREQFPETKTHKAVEVGLESDPHTKISVFPFEPVGLKETRVLVKRAAWQLLGRTNRTPVTIPAHYARWWHVSLFERAIVTDAAQNGVRIRERDKERAVELAKRAWKVTRELRGSAPEMKRVYSQALPEITSRENWARLFGV